MLYVGRRAPFPMGTNKLFKSKKMFLTYCFVSFWKMDLYSSSSMYSANPKSTFSRTILQIEMGVRVPEASHQKPSGTDQRCCRSGRSQGNLQPAGQRPARPWTPSSITSVRFNFGVYMMPLDLHLPTVYSPCPQLMVLICSSFCMLWANDPQLICENWWPLWHIKSFFSCLKQLQLGMFATFIFPFRFQVLSLVWVISLHVASRMDKSPDGETTFSATMAQRPQHAARRYQEQADAQQRP